MRLVQKIRWRSLDRHVHSEPYVAVVLSGGYEEAGDTGRFEVTAGSAVFHDRFEGHLNRFSHRGAVVLNLRLPVDRGHRAGIASLPDPEMVARVAESSPTAAVELLISTAVMTTPALLDWPDELAARLRQCPGVKLSEWGEQNGLAAWTISRGFAQVFGVSPEAFRARVRAQRAWKMIRRRQMPLAAIAAELRFADQAHMTRSVKQLTGFTPRAWQSLQMDSIP